MVMPPMRTSSNFPFSNVRTSSGSSNRFKTVSIIGMPEGFYEEKNVDSFLPPPIALPIRARIAAQLVAVLLHHLRVRGQRKQREVLPVQVIHEIEHARESSPGTEFLIPGSVGSLRPHEIRNAARDRIAPGVAA